ncbi:MAG: hypothetical protein RR942_13830 [Romboutsia sp.]
MKENFYPIDNEILKNSLDGAETIDYKKYPNILNILFNHWIIRKENYSRLESDLNRGEFELSIRIIATDFGITNYRAEKLIKDFIKSSLINPIKKGSDKDKKSIYSYNIFSDGSSDSNQTVNNKVEYSNIKDLDIINQTVAQTVNQTVNRNSKKELIKKNYKKEIYKASNEVICESIFEHWNSKSGVTHRELKPSMVKEIEKALKKYKSENILELAINNYDEILKSDYYYSYKFTLEKFLKQSNGVSEFLEEGSIYENYLEHKNKVKQHNTEKSKAEFNAFSTDVRL